MVIGIGENKANGRRCILVTLDEADIVAMGDGIELNQEAHAGFPGDLELLIAFAPDDYAVKVATTGQRNVTIVRQGPTQES